MMIQILSDMDTLLASDSHFLLGNWIESAKLKATKLEDTIIMSIMLDFRLRYGVIGEDINWIII